METVIRLFKISVLPLLFYCAPVWLERKVTMFDDLWYDMLKTATGSTFKPDKDKLEAICGIPPLDLQVKGIVIKFLIKNLLNHDNDIFKESISECTENYRHFVNQHSQYLKQYIAVGNGMRSANRICLQEYSDIKYTKTSIWNYISNEWKNRLVQKVDTEEDINWISLIQPTTMRTRLPRHLEVLLINLMHGHFPGNKFMWNLSQVPSPLCPRKTSIETGSHILFECSLYSENRSMDITNGNFNELIRKLMDNQPENKESNNILKSELKVLLQEIYRKRFKGELRIKKYMIREDTKEKEKDKDVHCA